MNVQVASIADYKLVSVEGRIDTTNAGEFEKSIMTVIEGASKIGPGSTCHRIYTVG